jgi:exosortase
MVRGRRRRQWVPAGNNFSMPIGVSQLEATATGPATSAAQDGYSLTDKVLLGAIVAAMVAFFCVVKLYAGQSIMVWAWKHWLPNLNQEHGKLVIPISGLLIWFHRKKIAAAAKEPSDWGWALLVGGLMLVLLGMRAQQPRITLLALPVLLFAIVLCIWGRDVGRILFFPIFFLIFMIPVGALQQASFRLQFLITGAVQALSKIVGINVDAIGTTLRAVNGAWGFDIAEGCSGIRSLIAIIMLTAIYVHIFEPSWWKKLVLLSCSIGFAIVANVGRIFTIILIARLGHPELAGGIYHEYSGFISFPVALGAMLLCHRLLNLGSHVGRPALEGQQLK